MIPDFDEFGNLPIGGHHCTWEEFLEKFNFTEHRGELCIKLKEILALAKRCGFLKVLIGGSFPTSKPDPSDMDLSWVTDVEVTKETVNPECVSLMEDTVAKTRYGWNMQYLALDHDLARIQFWARNFGYCFKTKRDRGTVVIDLL
jgi:hypothetical protein